MTTTSPLTDNRVETYLDRLADALAGFAPAERDEIVREIRAHIVDSAGNATKLDGIDRVLRLLGSPEELAERYSTEHLMARASRSFSPLVLVRTSWRWAKLGIKGTLAFLLALFGYTTALALTVALILKPIMPSRVGMWVGREGLNIGIPAQPGQMHEILGQWFVPVIAVCAFAIAVGTTHGLRWLIRSGSSNPAYHVPRAGVSRPA